MIESLPLPATDNPLDRDFWEHARRGRLVVQTCGDCGEMRFPPRPMCPRCQSEHTIWREDEGKGVVWSFATPRPPLLPAFEALLPYVVIIGALDSNPTIRIAAMAARDEDDAAMAAPAAGRIAIGQPIRIGFKAVSDECSLPFWRLRPISDRSGSGQ
jgi:uncharacterized OB-fold protein